MPTNIVFCWVGFLFLPSFVQSSSSSSFCSFISTFPVNPPALPNLWGFGPFGWAQNQTVLKGLEVLTGTVSDLCLSCHELPLVLLKTSKPVVQVCLYAVQLTFGIAAFQSAAHGTSCLPPELNDAQCLIPDKSSISHAYVSMSVRMYSVHVVNTDTTIIKTCSQSQTLRHVHTSITQPRFRERKKKKSKPLKWAI